MPNIAPIGFIDVSQMAGTLVMRHDVHFDDDTRLQDEPGSPYHDTKTILLRGPQGIHAAKGNDATKLWIADVTHENAPLLNDWPTARRCLNLIAEMLAKQFGKPPQFGKIMVEGLKPGGWIDWHVGGGAYADAHDRFVCPLVTCPGAFVLSGGEAASPAQGVLCYFNHHVAHSAINAGPIVRSHLVLDLRREEKPN